MYMYIQMGGERWFTGEKKIEKKIFPQIENPGGGGKGERAAFWQDPPRGFPPPFDPASKNRGHIIITSWYYYYRSRGRSIILVVNLTLGFSLGCKYMFVLQPPKPPVLFVFIAAMYILSCLTIAS